MIFLKIKDMFIKIVSETQNLLLFSGFDDREPHIKFSLGQFFNGPSQFVGCWGGRASSGLDHDWTTTGALWNPIENVLFACVFSFCTIWGQS